MTSPCRARRRLLLLAGIGLVAGRAIAADWNSLLATSPFGASPAAAPVAPDAGWEFRGVVTEGEGWLFCLYDSRSGASRWLRLRDQAGEVRLEGYDAPTETLQLMVANRPRSLELKRAKIILSAPVVVSDAGASGGAPSEVTAEAAALEEAIVREVRRRRAVRERESAAASDR